ncbi:MAG: hypothetical protein JW771_07840 [Candidatus Thermoplasmatota archaeon]|jgi:hypothetical protein|nr:hypothetical protein [Candidatus Thermoplasmatota archaeon]
MPQIRDVAKRIYGEAVFEALAKAQKLERDGKNIFHFEFGEQETAGTEKSDT